MADFEFNTHETNPDNLTLDYKFFIMRELPTGNKTKVFEVISKNKSEARLGIVKWYGAWRKYCFFPCDMCLFDDKCLDSISSFIKELMRKRHYANN